MKDQQNDVGSTPLLPAATVSCQGDGSAASTPALPAEGGGIGLLRSILSDPAPGVIEESTRLAKLITTEAHEEAQRLIDKIDAEEARRSCRRPAGNAELERPAQ